MSETMASPYCTGSYAPIATEGEARCELLSGEIPRDLDGLLVRNGPNPKFAPRGRYHWFDGDGMLHAVRIRDGRATYRNRWVKTNDLAREESEQRALWGGIMDQASPPARYKDTSNTDVIFHGGVLKTLWYLSGVPYRVDANSLETLGPDKFLGTYDGAVAAHAKVDPRSGELLFFDFGHTAPFMHFGVADSEGRLTHREPVPLPAARLPHDLAITENYAILMDLPVIFDDKAMAQGRWRTSFRRDLPARFAVVSRRRPDQQRWFEAEPCYIYHTINAWEEGDEIIMVGCRVADPYQAPRPEDGPWAVMMATLRIQATLHKWRFNLRTGETKEESLDDRNAEFPSIDSRVLGRRSRFAYNVIIGSEPTVFFDGIIKYDTETGESESLLFGAGRRGSESPFAPRLGSTGEDDGYILSFVHDEREARSELWIIDAHEPSRGAVARLGLANRVPLGFHAKWIAGDRLPS